MVKTPKMRHSKSPREPLTIDLDAQSVSGVDDASPAADVADTSSPTDVGTESGAASHVEQDEQPSAMREPSGYGFDTDAPTDQAKTSLGAAPSGRSAGEEGFSRVLAGVIGAVVALAIAAGLQYFGILGMPGASDSVSDPGVTAEIDTLKQKVAALETRPAATDLTGAVDALSSAMDAVKTDLAALRQEPPAGNGDVSAGLPALDARVTAVEAALSQIGQAGAAPASADFSGLATKIAALEAAVKAAGDSAGSGEGRIAALEQSVAALAAKVDAQAAQPKIALAIATAALKSAIERGAPFAAELETLAALAPDAPEIATLRGFAEKGVPSRDALIEAAGPAATAMIAAANAADPNAGFFDRLLQSAESLVTVRPIGAVEGTGVDAIVARMEAAVQAGNIDKAVAEFDTLPDTAKAAGSDFASRLKARQSVDKLVAQAIAAAMKA